jgi:hypothetical protein
MLYYHVSALLRVMNQTVGAGQFLLVPEGCQGGTPLLPWKCSCFAFLLGLFPCALYSLHCLSAAPSPAAARRSGAPRQN